MGSKVPFWKFFNGNFEPVHKIYDPQKPRNKQVKYFFFVLAKSGLIFLILIKSFELFGFRKLF